jgi:hypothetical protein
MKYKNVDVDLQGPPKQSKITVGAVTAVKIP